MFNVANSGQIQESGAPSLSRSVPCSWRRRRSESRAALLDSNWQSDILIYRRNLVDKGGDGQLEIKGSLKLVSDNSLVPLRYWLKTYGNSLKGRDPYLSFMPTVWDTIFADPPVTERFGFTDGSGFGMLGGIGVSKLNLSGYPSQVQSDDPLWGSDVTMGLSYYARNRIYDVDLDWSNIENNSTDTIEIVEVSVPSVRQYFGQRTMSGLSVLAALKYTHLHVQSGSRDFGGNSWGGQFGIGYETDLDQLTYSYHTNHEGYHQVELIISFQAAQQAKAGLRLSVRRGELVKTTTLQVYMANRIGFSTMQFQNPRSLAEQLIMYAGMAGAFMLLE